MLANQLSLPVQLPDHQDFVNFIIGDNQQIVQHLQTLSASTEHSISFISGASETGKTHLLYALCANVEGTLFVDCKNLHGLDPIMLEGIERSPAICIDNIDFLRGSLAWQTAIFDLINRIKEGNQCQLVVTAAMSAKAIDFELPDLTSRLTWGVSFHLQPLSDKHRASLLILRAKQRGLDMSEDVASYLLSRGKRDIKTLMLTIARLDELSLQQQRRLTIPFVKQILD